ncbi:MAG: glf [Firmicutes bacterium]|nr:glf [Bacillota bacterium]
MEKCDWLIVGAGLFGSIFAHEMSLRRKKCIVIDRRQHVGGNLYCEKIEDINVHRYGAHIFHTNNKKIWDYVNSFIEFNGYINSPIAVYKDELYNLPFNMNTFYQLWKLKTPREVKDKIAEQIKQYNIEIPKNLEEQALKLVGPDIYYKLIKGYTEKQWERSATELPAFIIRRLPVRFTYDNNYFNDKYQGVPVNGYNCLIEKLLAEVEVHLTKDFFSDREFWYHKADKILFTGMIDEFYDYEFGQLEYRSLYFEDELLDLENYQGNAVVNYTERSIPFTRIIEHKHFEYGKQPKTVITKEYPVEWHKGNEPYYPVNDEKNQNCYNKYAKKARQETKIIFGGRLAEYKYYDMDQVIERALMLIESLADK